MFHFYLLDVTLLSSGWRCCLNLNQANITKQIPKFSSYEILDMSHMNCCAVILFGLFRRAQTGGDDRSTAPQTFSKKYIKSFLNLTNLFCFEMLLLDLLHIMQKYDNVFLFFDKIWYAILFVMMWRLSINTGAVDRLVTFVNCITYVT